MDRFQVSRDDHGCRLIRVEGHFDRICDVFGTKVRVVWQNDSYIYLQFPSFTLSDLKIHDQITIENCYTVMSYLWSLA